MLSSVSGIIIVILLIALGVIIADRPWFGEAGSNFICAFTLNFTLPCMIFYNTTTMFPSREDFLRNLPDICLPLGAIFLTCLVSLVIARAAGLKRERDGLFVGASAFCNSVFVGFPIVEAILGEAALRYAILYCMANLVVFWSLGAFLLSRDGALRTGKRAGFFSLSSLSGLLSPSFVAFLAGVAVLLSGLTVPALVTDAAKELAQMCSTLALVYIGTVIRRQRLQDLRPNRELVLAFFGRFVLTPGIMLGVLHFFPVSPEITAAFYLQAAMPMMTQLPLCCDQYGSDTETASVMATASTCFALVMMPVYILVCSHILG